MLSRLGGIEDVVVALGRLPAVSQDAEASEVTAQLAGRVGLLRNTIDALGQPGPHERGPGRPGEG